MNATSYYQGVLKVLKDLVGRACIIYDDVKMLGRERCPSYGVFAIYSGRQWSGASFSRRITILFAKEVVLCGKVSSAKSANHHERNRGLLDTRRSQMMGELMLYLQAANWMRLSLPITAVLSSGTAAGASGGTLG